MAFREKRGSFNVGRRIEQAAGMLSKIMYDLKIPRNDLAPVDFMPHEQDSVQPKTDDEVMRMAMQQWG